MRNLPPLRLLRFTQFLLQLPPATIEVSVLTFHLRKILCQQIEHTRLLRQNAQNIQTHDVP